MIFASKINLPIIKVFLHPQQYGLTESRPSILFLEPGHIMQDAKKRILLVEDHADSLVMTAKILRMHGYDVSTATTKAEALELCKATQFEVLVGDLQLPDGTGWEMMEEILKVCKIKSIAYTGYGYDSDIQHSRAAGFTVHLTKPAEINVLLDTIDRLLAGADLKAYAAFLCAQFSSARLQ